jgi:hypothetical protein
MAIQWGKQVSIVQGFEGVLVAAARPEVIGYYLGYLKKIN